MIVLVISLIGAYELRGRSLFTISGSALECQTCLNSNFEKISCWDRMPDGSGNVTRGYCCSPGEEKCANFAYCASSSSTNIGLRLMTCPVDVSKCPSGSDAIIQVGSKPKLFEWPIFTFRQFTTCKLKLDFSSHLNVTALNLKIENL